MDIDSSADQQQSKSVSCRLPENLDKQAAKVFFSKFGVIKRFILRPKRNECTVEYETVEAAQQALSYQGNFQIFPTPVKAEVTDDFVDPDVQSELDLMYPSGIRAQAKQGLDSFIRTPQAMMMKPKVPAVQRLKTEPLSVSVGQDPRLSNSINVARNELEHLVRRPARSAEEKLQILDARDKLFRLVNAKSTDITKATSTKGTCKDMCPEKERIMREARLQVASFELSDYDSSMDQQRAIKQYSRSAADAETPLPHELRPESSLKTTMTYLLHNIMNSCDDENTSIGDWFHFVWDRTRGIRKDITQQELCSIGTVELVEQCVRFHIHCSARLIAEDPSIFDQRINTENLTKCLQTLKYMYNDLKLKNIKCPNEAEFRAYVVLLNLNESGNFLWEIKQLEKSILNSKEVRFALDVYFAVSNNNYVKFFNLVRDTSYMGACLLLRYFTQVRMKAISIIMKAYTPRKVGFNYNISYLTEILAFEDFETTVSFLNHHGFMCDTDADIVQLDRSMFSAGETAYQMERAIEMVESKMESTVAQAVCGGSLPSPDAFLKLMPHSSFDNDGFLKRESFYAEDQNGPSPNLQKEGVFKIPRGSPPISPRLSHPRNDQPDGLNETAFYRPPAANPFSAPRPSPPAAKNVFKNDLKPSNPFARKEVPFGSSQQLTTSQSIFGSSPQSSFTSPKAAMPRVDPAPPAPPSSFSFLKSVAEPAPPVFGGSGFGSLAKSFEIPQPFGFSFKAAEELEEKRKQEAVEKLRLEAELKAREKAEEEDRIRLQKELEEQQERERQEAEELEREEQKRKQEEIAQRAKALQESCQAILDSLVHDVVDEKVKQEAQKSHKLFVKIPEEFYEAIEYDVTAEVIDRIHQQEFLAYVNALKRKYETMQTLFESWRETTRNERRRRDQLSTIGCAILNTSLEDQAAALHHPEQRAAIADRKQYLSGSPQSINLLDIKTTAINLFDKLKVKPIEANNIFWKVLISIPHKNEENLAFSTFINKWLGNTFEEMTEDEEVFFLKEQTFNNTRRKFAICMRKVQGAEMLDEKGRKSTEVCKHSNGIVFFTASTNLPASRKRLQNILDKLELPVPVSLIIYMKEVKTSDERELRQHFDLSQEVNVSSFEMNLYYQCVGKEKNLNEVVVESCQFLNDQHTDLLSRKDCRLFDLQMQHIIDFSQLTIGDEMWRRVESSCSESLSFKKTMTRFNNIVLLFNACIDKVLLELTFNDFSKVISIPDEFRKKLPPVDPNIPNGYEFFPQDWKSKQNQKQHHAFLYELKLMRMDDDRFKSFNDFKQKFETFLSINMNVHNEKVFQLVVDKVVTALYHQNVSSDEEAVTGLQNFCWLNVLGEIVVGKFNEDYRVKKLPTFVIYYKKDLHRYRTAPWWFSLEYSQREADEPLKKKLKINPPTNEEIALQLSKSTNTLKKLNSNIETFKEVCSKTRLVSKDVDQFFYDAEENIRGSLKNLEDKVKE